jgi:hypothetical protein
MPLTCSALEAEELELQAAQPPAPQRLLRTRERLAERVAALAAQRELLEASQLVGRKGGGATARGVRAGWVDVGRCARCVWCRGRWVGGVRGAGRGLR